MSNAPIVAELAAYASAGYELIPLHRWDAVDGEGQHRGKTPRDARWRDEQYAIEDAQRWAGAGFNVGVRLRDSDVVVDYDPRNAPPGRDVLGELEMEFGLDLNSAPCVRTGGGGLHFYFRAESGQRFRNHLDEFPGVEFKSYGRQVVAAGSVHPNGAHYLWREARDSELLVQGVPLLPEALVAAIAKPAAKPHPEASAGPDRITVEELAKVLSQLDPVEFREHDDWLEIMLASHSATRGEGVEEFVAWSTRDPNYAGDGGVIRERWNSLDPNKPGGVTVATLYWRVLDAGGSLPRISAEEDFEAILENGPAGGVTAKLKRMKNGEPLQNLANGMIATGALGLRFVHDEMLDQIRVEGNTAFLRAAYPGLSMTWSDALNVVIRVICEREFGLTLSGTAMQDVAIASAQSNRVNPLTSWLDGLSWDRRPRLDGWLVNYAGAPDSPYVRAVGRVMLLGAVARAYHPGIKFDTMVVLEGPQGSGKSSLVRILGGQWTLEGLPQGNERDIVHSMLGHWFVEMEEMAHLRRTEVNQLKAFLSRTRDVVRLAYERTAREIPRRCIIIGTTNDSAYLSDATGNRRFLPVETESIDLAALARDRDQLLAEAVEAWRSNPVPGALELTRNIWGEAAEEQEQRRHVDPWEEAVEPLLNAAAEADGWITTMDVVSKLSFKTVAELKPQDYSRFNRVMQARRKWKAMRMMVKGVNARGYLLRGGALHKKWGNTLGK